MFGRYSTMNINEIITPENIRKEFENTFTISKVLSEIILYAEQKNSTMDIAQQFHSYYHADKIQFGSYQHNHSRLYVHNMTNRYARVCKKLVDEIEGEKCL